MGGMDFDSTHEQDEAARLFLPDIDPEDAVGWPSDGSNGDEFDDGMFQAFEDDPGYLGAYESDLTDMLDIQDSLLADYGPTHGFDVTEWEE